MTFLNPLVLLALAAAAIPLIIHLINLRKPRRIDFSSLVLLHELRQQVMRRLRIKQWLLLALRTLAIAFLVLAFARPTVKSSSIGRLSTDDRSVVVVLDNSVSMTLRDDRGSFLSQASDFTATLANDLDGSDELSIVTLVADGRERPFGRPALASMHLADIGPTFGRGRMMPALADVEDVLKTASYPARDVYVVSDFQTTLFVDTVGADLSDAGNVVLVPIGQRAVDNVALTSVRVATSIVEIDQPVAIDIDVENFGRASIKNWGLSVYLEGERVAQTAVSMEAGQSGVASVTLTPRARGWLRGKVVLEDDGFEYDNERFFTLHVPEKRTVLVVRGTDRETAFLDLALSTKPQDGRAVFEQEIAEERALSGRFSGKYDAVVLVGVRNISAGTAEALAAFVHDGGGLFVFAGEEAAEGAYNHMLRLVGAGTFDGLASAAPGGILGTLDQLDLEHPLFRNVFADGQHGGKSVERPSLSKIVRYRAGDGDEQTIMRTSLGLSMLQEVRYGAGRLLIAPFVPESEWTDLPVRGLFVPLLFRSMYYLTSADAGSGDGLQSGTNAPFHVVVRKNVDRIRIVSESGLEWIPEQRTSAQGLYFTLPLSLRTPGVYDVIGGEELLQRFALNMDPLESNLEPLDLSEAEARLRALGGKAVSLLDVSSTQASNQSIRLPETGVEIWNVLLSIALIFLIAEMLVAARWKPAAASPASK